MLGFLDRPAHPLNRPEEVHRRGAGIGEAACRLLERRGPVPLGKVRRPLRSDHHPVGGGDADGRGAADDHPPDGIGHLLRRPALGINFLGGQPPLIDQAERPLPVFERVEISLDFQKFSPGSKQAKRFYWRMSGAKDSRAPCRSTTPVFFRRPWRRRGESAPAFASIFFPKRSQRRSWVPRAPWR